MLKYNITEELINRIERKIYKNEKISINDIEKMSGYSKRYIQSIFKDVTGLKISSYIRKRRLSHSAILLRLTKRSVSHISLDLNFPSLQTFTRAFTREFNVSPLQYRKDPFFDCSVLIPPFSLNPQEYILRKDVIPPLKLNVKEFRLKETLLGSKLTRAEKIRKKEIETVLSEKTEAFVITYLIPESTLEHTVLLKTLIGSRHDTPNYQREFTECWIVYFRGLWEDYVRFGRFLTFNIDVKLAGTVIEQITLFGQDGNHGQKYSVKMYFPVQ
ncbi:helix-turn-helix domain-containing protein [Escherichia coli]|nr:helix-turn-helix domain-containing protein [Escherichia coli]